MRSTGVSTTRTTSAEVPWQQLALDGVDIGGPLGRDLGGIVGEEIAITLDRGRPLHIVDIALDDFQAGHASLRRKILGRHDRARERIAIAAVFGSDALGQVVERLERNLTTDQVAVEWRKL